jgi:hypothetical protein
MKEQYKEALQNDVCVVKFVKKDGSIRTMKCTLISAMLPVRAITEEIKPKREENPNIIVVYDLEKEAFRSIILDSILEFNQNV